MFQKFKRFCQFTTKPSYDDLLCDGKGWGREQKRGVL